MGNFGFETDDATQAGNPDEWKLSGPWGPVVGLFTLPIGETPVEDFEQEWGANGYLSFIGVALQIEVEDYEQEWADNENYEQVIPINVVVDGTFNTGADLFETFEQEWADNENYEQVIPTNVVVDGTFTVLGGPPTEEQFEEVWSGNENYLTALPTTNVVPAIFGNVPKLLSVVTVNIFSDVFTTSAPLHNLAGNDAVTFTTSVTLPNPLVAGVLYFVRTENGSDEFTLSATFGGPLLNITTSGVGFQTVTAMYQSEDFETVRLEQQVVVDVATDILTTSTPPLNLAVDDIVTFRTTSQLPSPLAPGYKYLVHSTNAVDDFRIKGTIAGVQIDIVDVGIGQHFVQFDPADAWTTENTTV